MKNLTCHALGDTNIPENLDFIGDLCCPRNESICCEVYKDSNNATNFPLVGRLATPHLFQPSSEGHTIPPFPATNKPPSDYFGGRFALRSY